MAARKVTVLGGGNTAFSVAAKLTLDGVEVALYELPEFASTLEPVTSSRSIRLEGVAGNGTASIAMVTTNAAEALAFSDLALLIVPAYAHKAFAESCAPHLTDSHTVVLVPGTLGSLEWARILREQGAPSGVTLAEVDTAPYVCRKTSPDTATIWGVVTGLGVGVLPSSRTESVRSALDGLFPGMLTYPDVMACGLSAINPVVHPAGVVMNAGRIEYSRGEFYFYEEGITPSVAKVIMQVDQERRDIGKAMGYNLIPADEAFHKAGFGPRGDLWATVNGSLMLTRLKAPGTLQNRWLSEDVPYGIATWARIGARFGVDTPLMRAFVDISSVVMGVDGWSGGRSLDDLGISDMDVEQLKSYLATGTP